MTLKIFIVASGHYSIILLLLDNFVNVSELVIEVAGLMR